MMKILAVANHKGGVGKTTIALHLAYLAHEQGRRVLMVEFDSQRNASSSFAQATGTHLVASDLFAEDITDKKPETTGGIGLIRADGKLADIAAANDTAVQTRPDAHIRALATEYDLCIIDTPAPLANPLLSALIAADYAVAPLRMDKYSLDGVGEFNRTIQAVRNKGLNRQLKFLGLLPNVVKMVSKLQREGLEILRNTKNIKVLPFIITDRVAITEAASNGNPVWYKPKDAGHKVAASEMRAACEHILKEVLS